MNATVARLGWVLVLGLAVLAAPAAAADDATYSVQFVLRDGHIAVDPAQSRVDFRDAAASFGSCRLGADAVARQLNGWLASRLRQRGRLLTQLVLGTRDPRDGTHASARRDAERRLEALAATDPQTAALWRADGPWLSVEQPVNAWVQARRAESAAPLLDAERTLFDIYELLTVADHDLAGSPLLPLARSNDDVDRNDLRNGRATFRLSPPLRGAAAKLRPTANVDQWLALRGDLGAEVLADFECRLWFSQPIVQALQDYLEPRGVALAPYRTAEDLKNDLDLGQVVDRPSDRAALRLERPSVTKKSDGGRIHLDPDPTPAAVYVLGQNMSQLQRALYLLLPTPDFDRIRARPQDFLCRADAVWKPPADGAAPLPAVQLPLDGESPGAGLTFARQYLSRRLLAERLARLPASGLQARLDLADDRVPPGTPRRSDGLSPVLRTALLLVEPAQGQVTGPDSPELLALPRCSTRRDAPEKPLCKAGQPPPVCRAPSTPLDTPEAGAMARGDTTSVGHSRKRDGPPRNHVELSVEQRAGKSARWGASYRHQREGNEDAFVIAFGQQRESSGELSYASDFAGFGALGRRVQWSARAYDAFDPDRGLATLRPDERRRGVELRAGIDLWRDVAASFGQIELGLNRERIELQTPSAMSARDSLTRAEVSLTVARAVDATPAAPREQALLRLERGQGDSARFGRVELDAAARRFISRTDRWDVRLRLAALRGEAPVAEHLAFGGDDSVRGYRSDRVAARRIWALQNEWWMPVPWQPDSPALARLLGRQAALALLLDVGGVHQPLTPFERRVAGAGIGLRMAQGDALTIKLDLAAPIGAESRNDRRARLHLGIALRPTL